MSNKNWLGEILLNLAPENVSVANKTPESLVSEYSWKAFGVSTLAGLAPGPIGMATILPELVAVTKLQITLIYAIAKYYNKQNQFNSTTVLIIFANETGIALKGTIQKVGAKMIIKVLTSSFVQAIASKIGFKIIKRVVAKAVGRWMPVVMAPIFGMFSKTMTEKIGQEAISLFQSDFIIQPDSTDIVKLPDPTSSL